VTALLAGRPKNRDLIPGRDKCILSSRMYRQDMGQLASFLMELGVFPGDKVARE
jgi:hypothetical protein